MSGLAKERPCGHWEPPTMSTVVDALGRLTNAIRDGVRLDSQAQEKREVAAVRRVFRVIGLPQPTDKECGACLPW